MLIHTLQNCDWSTCERWRCPCSGEAGALKTPRPWGQSPDSDRRQAHRPCMSLLAALDGAFINITKATAGLLADGRQLAGRTRDEAANYRDTYGGLPPLKVHRECCSHSEDTISYVYCSMLQIVLHNSFKHTRSIPPSGHSGLAPSLGLLIPLGLHYT
jgi:hypothetical protein